MGGKKIRTAVIGVGHLGRWHAQKYSVLEESELVGVVDTDIKRAEEYAAAYSTRAFASYRDLFGKVDAVSVVTPTESHLRIGLDFLSRGVDVLMEKPIALTPVEAEQLINEAARTGSVLQVGHVERFNAAILALEGRVNNPVFLESRRLSPFPNRSTDIDVVLDLMIHDIDVILSLVKSEVVHIDAVGIPVISDKVDLANARIAFKNGCVANVTASRADKERARSLTVVQHDAHISVDYANQHISVSRLMPASCGGLNALVDEEIDIVKNEPLLEEIRSFLGCSARRGTPLVTGEDGLRALEVAHKIQKAVGVSMKKFTGGKA